ncbi:Kelch-type beta propeller,Galactose oxidase, beta-propeller [Cinara cedri]|uniref:Kelch-type beta propeller,Galactose oxidase, beta-propeller n=1 Tax=Cinara cedri TaxID=506608 RepID=A0A5E4M8L3_9HEMI|nr:Kelch-type beta propeller,Galactose oxidase, beta-propeller [Cinara cedri]
MSLKQYVFQPFKFQTIHSSNEVFTLPIGITDGIVCTDNYLITYEGSSALKSSVNIWKFFFDSSKWRRVRCKGVPQELSSFSVLLSGSLIILYGIPHAPVSNNRVYCGNLDHENKPVEMAMKEIEICGSLPEPRKECAQGVVLDGKNIFVVGGAPGNETELDVFQLDLVNKSWIQLYSAYEESDLVRDSHQIVFYNDRLFMFNSRPSTNDVPYNFSKIHTFDLMTNEWEIFPAKPDYSAPLAGYPINRNGQNCVQCPKNKNFVYLCGGHNSQKALYDMWLLDLNTIQWKYLPKCIMPVAIFNSHSMAVSTNGRLCCYGGRFDGDSVTDGFTNNITTGWMVIPKLEVICWEAVVFYFKDQMVASTREELKELGLPIKCYNRMVEAKSAGTFYSLSI